jgi:hypothetical protein
MPRPIYETLIEKELLAKRIQLASDTEGKTIARMAVNSHDFTIVFTDGTWASFEYDGDYLICYVPDPYDFKQVGLITQEQYNQHLKEKADLSQQAIEDADRRAYERLKAKFEPQS